MTGPFACNADVSERSESSVRVQNHSQTGPSLSPPVSVPIAVCAAIGLFLIIADLGEHQRLARIAIELALCLPAILVSLRYYIHLRHLRD